MFGGRGRTSLRARSSRAKVVPRRGPRRPFVAHVDSVAKRGIPSASPTTRTAAPSGGSCSQPSRFPVRRGPASRSTSATAKASRWARAGRPADHRPGDEPAVAGQIDPLKLVAAASPAVIRRTPVHRATPRATRHGDVPGLSHRRSHRRDLRCRGGTVSGAGPRTIVGLRRIVPCGPSARTGETPALPATPRAWNGSTQETTGLQGIRFESRPRCVAHASDRPRMLTVHATPVPPRLWVRPNRASRT